MENSSQIPLLRTTREEMTKIRQNFGLDPKKINENLDAIEEWCKKQDHLQEALQYIDRNALERLHILSKGSVEATKIKIDKILTARGLLPELLFNISVDEFESFKKTIYCLILPNLHPICRSRIIVIQILSENLDDFNLLTCLRYCYMIGEIRLNYEYSMSDRYIVNFKNMNKSIITKINPVLVKKAEILCTEVYGMKVNGIHFINAPPFADKIIYILKQVLKEKISRRIHVHKSYEELYKEIPKEVLPNDFDGNLPSCATLTGQWMEFLKTEEVGKIVEKLNKLVSDETKRTSMKFNEEYLGMPGSFKRLDLD